MSLFKKILGIAAGEPPRQKIPRAPRIRLKEIHHVILTSPRWNGQIMKVVNISTTGVGVQNSERPDDLVQGSLFPAMLTLNQKTLPVLLKIAYLSEDIIGCSFEDSTGQIKNAVLEYFIAEISGMEVVQINPKLLKPDPRGEALWFFGSNNSEVYFTLKNSQITYFHTTLLGNYIECYADRAPKFGYVISQEGQNKMKPDQAAMIQYTETMPRSTVDLFAKFIQHIEDLGIEYKSLILNVLEEIQSNTQD